MDSIKLLVLEELLRKDPESRVFLRLAEELRKEGQYERAIEVCKAGLPKHQGYVPAMVSLGRSCQAIGRNDEAEAVFDEVLALAPDNTHALRGLGHLLAERGEHGKALEYLEHLQLYEPNDEEIQQQIEDLKAQGGASEPEGWAQEYEIGADDQEVPKAEAGLVFDEDEESSDVPPPVPKFESSVDAVLQSVPEENAGFEPLPEDPHDSHFLLEENADPQPASVGDPELLPEAENDEESPSVMDGDAALQPAEEIIVALQSVPEDDPEFQPASEDDTGQDDSMADLDREFEKALDEEPDDADLFTDSEALTEELDVKAIQSEVKSRQPSRESDFDEWVTRGLKHEKMEHLEEALGIYQKLLERYPDHTVVLEHLERVKQLAKNESLPAKKIRTLSNWLDKIKGVYHVS